MLQKMRRRDGHCQRVFWLPGGQLRDLHKLSFVKQGMRDVRWCRTAGAVTLQHCFQLANTAAVCQPAGSSAAGAAQT